MSKPSRFRVFRGRVDGNDLANIHTLGKLVGSAITSEMQGDLSTTADGLILDSLSLDNSGASHVFIGGRFPNACLLYTSPSPRD